MRSAISHLLRLTLLLVLLASVADAQILDDAPSLTSSNAGSQMLHASRVGNLAEDWRIDTDISVEPVRTQGGLKLDNVRVTSDQQWLMPRDTPMMNPDTSYLSNIDPGQMLQYVFSASHMPAIETPDSDDLDPETRSELRKRQAPSNEARTIWISINTCEQPDFTQLLDAQSPPQLTLSLSTPPSPAQDGGPTSAGSVFYSASLIEGFANYNGSVAGDVYVNVRAPSVDSASGTWNFELAASVTAPYHAYNASNDAMVTIDTDSGAALLIMNGNITAYAPEWQDGAPLPFGVIVQNMNDTSINGVRASYCGLERTAQIPGPDPNPQINATLTNYLFNYTANGTKIPFTSQQFYVPKLNATSDYLGYLVKSADKDTVGGGGKVYNSTTFSTKSFANCQLIYGLNFCDTVAYAAPSNPGNFSDANALAALYDNDASYKYQRFDWSLQQIACDTTPSAQYSLAKTCTDCRIAYKQWLCAVTIPRCTDWNPDPSTGPESYAIPRNAVIPPLAATPDIVATSNITLRTWTSTNSSRNPSLINVQIGPGPYNEILPCSDLCHELVRACPAALQFSCPVNVQGLNRSYSIAEPVSGGCSSCSEPGAFCGRNEANRLPMERCLIWLAAFLVLYSLV